MNSLETYAATLAPLNDFTNLPLITQRRNLRNKGAANPVTGVEERFASAETVASIIGTQIHNAGVAMLESIHQEIDAATPEWQKTYDADQEAEQTRPARCRRIRNRQVNP